MAIKSSAADIQNLLEVYVESAKEYVSNGAQSDHDPIHHQSILILGAPGIGKSAICKEVCKENNIGFVDLRLLLMSETDLKGIPFPDKEHKHTAFLSMDLLPRVERDGEVGIIVLEEITAAPRSVQTAAYQLTLDRQINQWHLPPGWIIVANGNRQEDLGEFYDMPPALANRFVHYELAAEGEEFVNNWIKWALAKNVIPEIIGFITHFPQYLHKFDTELFEEGEWAFPTPRRWECLSNMIKSFKKVKWITDEGTMKPSAQASIIGQVGEEVGYAFIKFYEFRTQMVDPNIILRGDTNYEMPVNDSAIHMTVASLLSMAGPELRKDTLSEKGRKYLENIVNFIVRIKAADFVAVSLMNLLTMNPKVLVPEAMANIDHPQLDDFIMRNKNIL